MVELRSTPIRIEVKQWWQTVKAEQGLFLRLVALDSIVEKRFDNLGQIVTQLERDAQYLSDLDYPESVHSIREHLLESIEHLIECLRNLQDRQLFDADLRFSIAQVDMNLVQHELLEYRVVA